ncbi:MAG TPA: LAGLIDADG family homing endonuclease [Acidimicrobiia bacterium]|nr:LAGLIDADG family homing endonuclease [Acidimicrobiia bacterium]
MTEGLRIPRRFTEEGRDPYSSIEWAKRDSRITNPDGSVVFEVKDAEVPASWSQVATDIIVSKYFRKAGVPQVDDEGNPVLDEDGEPVLGGEISSRQVFDRLAGTWRWWGENHGYFATPADAQAFEDELKYMLANQIASPNSPQWFNTGLAHAYDITGTPQGFWFVDPQSGEMTESPDAYSHPAPHACFINSVKDDLVNPGGIMDLWVREARLFKMGSGCTSGDSRVYVKGEGFIPIRDLFQRYARQGRPIQEFDGKGRYIDIGDEDVFTLSIDEKTGKYNLDKVELVWAYDVAEDDKLTVRFDTGAEAIVSEWHPFLVWDGENVVERRADQLRRGDAVLGPNESAVEAIGQEPIVVDYETSYFRHVEKQSVVLDEDLAWLVGYFVGDGSLGIQSSRTTNKYGRTYEYRRPRVRFFDETEDNLRRVQETIRRNFGETSSMQPIDTDQAGQMLTYTGRRVTGFISSLFEPGPKDNQRLPGFLWTGGPRLTLAFLAGLMDSDGTVASGRASVFTASRSLAEDLAVLVSFHGMGGGLTRSGNGWVVTILRKSAPLPKRDALASLMSHPHRRQRLLEHVAGRAGERAFCMPLSRDLAQNLFGKRPPADWLRVRLGKDSFHLGRLHYEGLVNPRKLQRAVAVIDRQDELASTVSRVAGSVAFVSSVTTCTTNPDFYDLTVANHSNYLAGRYGLVAIHNTGSNFSSIRSENERLSGGGKSSGVMSFLKIGDRAAGAIKSGGTTRRAAKMVILDLDHPDIEEFIDWKKHEEEKARTLIQYGGYPADFNGEAYATVSGQNSNNSVRVPNEFIEAVRNDDDWQLTDRTTGKVRRTVKARDLWRRVAEAAWACADPGVQFDTIINEWHTSPAGGKIRATNPCSEYVFLDDTACNLASINLIKFFDDATNSFDVEAYEHAIRLWTIVLEVSVTMAHFPSKEIAQGSYDYRTLGLGYANLGTLLMRMGLPYDSGDGRAVAGAITAILTGYAYATSAELAAAVGPFPRFAENRESMLRVIRNHRRAAYDAEQSEYEGLSHYVVGINGSLTPSNLLTAARQSWDLALDMGERHGYRNAQVSVIAPTGCLIGGTLVPTERGLVRLATLGDPHGGQWQDLKLAVGTDEGPRTATHFYVNGVEPVVTVDTGRGYRLQGTATHRVKVVQPDGSWTWKRFAEVEEGDLVPLQLDQLIGEPQPVLLPPLGDAHWTADFTTKVPGGITPELAEFVGYFMGDGSLHAKGIRLTVTAGDFDVVERLSLLGKDLFNLEAKVAPRQGYEEVAFNSVPLAVWWEACGFSKKAPSEGHVGKGWHPHVPEAILATNDRRTYTAFIKGLFEADGYAHSHGYPSWTTTSLEFAADVQSLLLAIGYPMARKFDTTGWGQSTSVTLRPVNASYHRRWAAEIGFISGRKQAGIVRHQTQQAARRDYVPVPRSLIDELHPLNDGLRRTMLLSMSRIGLVSRRSAEELLERTGDPRLAHLLGFFYDQVNSVELGEEQLTYDLSVPDNVTYVANGFVSHNTIGLQMDCDTTGVEPDFALVKFKKLAGGGYFKIVNQSVAPALRNLGYDEVQIQEIVRYIVGTSSLQGAPHINPETLRDKGLNDDDLAKIEATLPAVFELKHAFNPFVLGEATLQRLGFAPEEYATFDFDLLRALGYSGAQIREATEWVCGEQTIEGAPHLREEHLAVFDTANRNGRRGQRLIHHTGHIKMLAATQPFLSGAASKTINMPNEATVEDIEESYMLSYELGVKCMALYRDGSKASQPLSASSDDAQSEEEPEEVTKAHEIDKQILWGKIPAGLSPTQAYARGMHPPRFLLPARRGGYTQEAKIGGHKVYLRTGEYEDGTLGELFIDLAKEGATLRGILSCFAIAVSKGLQFGVPLEEFVDTFTFQTFEPRGMVEGHPNIKMANSIVDYVFRALAVEYLRRDDLAQVPPVREGELPEPASGLAVEAGVQLDLTDAVAERDVTAVASAVKFLEGSPGAPIAQPTPGAQLVTRPGKAAKIAAAVGAKDAGTAAMQSALSEMMGDAPICDICGHITIRNGACYKCLNCGNSLGCS